MNHTNQIQKLCQRFRTDTLKITLEQLGEFSNTSIGTLSAFEQGRSTNINHLITYLKPATPEQKLTFFSELETILRSV